MCDMELRKENTERKRKRKIVTRGPELVRSVKAGQGQVISVTYNNETRTPAGIWKRA